MRIPRPPKLHRSSKALLLCHRRHRPLKRPLTQLQRICRWTDTQNRRECDDCEPFMMERYYDYYPRLMAKPNVCYHYSEQPTMIPGDGNKHYFVLYFRNERVLAGLVTDLHEAITMSIGFLAYRLRLPIHDVKQMIIEDAALEALAGLGSTTDVDGCCV